ncbi:hypothetical protein ACFV9C_33265 [Kribbella sp. NPDC059898]|uniref:hypothetical protein n=1 Tax=Kribbella sp. NPDC059898 TaxID=3346995 RepID=UPI003659A28D
MVPEVVTVSANTYDRLGARNDIWGQDRYRAADAGAGGNDVEDLANALIRFSNGASLAVDVSYSPHATADSLGVAIYGEKVGTDLEPLRVATAPGGRLRQPGHVVPRRLPRRNRVRGTRGRILDLICHSAANGWEIAAE